MLKNISTGQPDHLVQFYDTDAFLLERVNSFIGESDGAIVIAKKAHRKGINQSSGTLILDADETLAKFMVGGMPDPEKFFSVVGRVVKEAEKSSKQLRAFGEMVAILWDQGNGEGAIALEKLWNDLQTKHAFSLLCAYPMNKLGGKDRFDDFANVCLTHSHVFPTESYSQVQTGDQQLRIIAALQQKAMSLEQEILRREAREWQKHEFIAVASHELKTPVTSLKLFTQILLKKKRNERDLETVKYLEKMDERIDKLVSVIRELLDYTKVWQ